MASGLEAVLETLRFHALFGRTGREARAHFDIAALFGFRGKRLVLRGALAQRGRLMNGFGAGSSVTPHSKSQSGFSLFGGRYALVVEAALVHGVGLADENVRGHFVLGAAKLTERRQKDQIIKRLGG